MPSHNDKNSPDNPVDYHHATDARDFVFRPESFDERPLRPHTLQGEEVPILKEPDGTICQMRSHDKAEELRATATIPIASFAFVAAIALMPMLLTHFGHLSRMAHRAHYGLVIGAFAALFVQRWYRSSRQVRLDMEVPDVVLLVGSAVVFAIASRVGSPWVGTLSCVLLAGFFLRRFASVDNVGYLGPWSCLLLLLPLPVGMDQKLISFLQEFATGSSSRLLDLMGVNHLVSGNILELPGSQLFVDEACSGIQSLFAMITCVAFFAAWTRRPAVLAVSLVAASVVMCTIVNIIRIVIVVHAEVADITLTSGWPHELLGITMFLLALLLVYCSEGLFLFLLAPIINPATGTPDNRSAQLWNNLTQSIHGAVFGVTDTESSPSRGIRRPWLGITIPPQAIRSAMFVATICFAIFGMGHHVTKADGKKARRITQAESAMVERSEALKKSSLPETIGPWKQASFERLNYNRSAITDSVAWVYRSPFYEVTVSLDYPFYGAHNVSDCYHMRGWDVQERVTTEAGYSKAKLNRPFGETAVLLYDVFDSQGTVELETAGGRILERIREFEDKSERPTWQLQLIVRSDFGLSGNDLQEIEAIFVDLRTRIRGLVLASHNTSGASADQVPLPQGGTSR
ncbi:MAG: exosortase U [Planctomycetaceae bacterium]